jgi:hypothetical protein
MCGRTRIALSTAGVEAAVVGVTGVPPTWIDRDRYCLLGTTPTQLAVCGD